MNNIKQNKIFFLVLVIIVIPIVSGARLPINLTHKKQISQGGEYSVLKQGVNIELTLNPLIARNETSTALREGKNVQIRFALQDATTKEPIRGLHPLAWIDRQNESENDLSCKQRISSYLQGKLAFQPEVNLNSYYVLVLNNKASISVIDPLGGYGSSKLITRILLKSPGTDWVLSHDSKRLYVATPLSRQVAVIDTSVWKVINYLEFTSEPTRLALQPDGQYLWVGLTPTQNRQGFSGAIAVNTEDLEIAGVIATGSGTHFFSFSDDDQFIYVSNSDDKTISIIDVGKLSQIKDIKLKSKPVALAYSKLAKTLYVAGENGTVITVGSDSHEINNSIELDSPLHSMKFTPDGRWGFTVSRQNNRVFIFDVSVNRITQSAEVGMAPDQISFSDTFAYIRSSDSETVSMIQLDNLAMGEPMAISTFPGGQRAPGGGTQDLLDSAAIVPTPERNAVLIANPADKIVYYYMEGMAAPMGSFKNYGLDPMAVLVVDKSLQETKPGIYEGTVQLPPSGSYSIPVLINNPSVFHCFSAEVSPNPNKKENIHRAKDTIEYLVGNKTIPVGESTVIQMKIAGFSTEIAKVQDLKVLTFLIPGTWQQRIPAKALGNGIYQIEFTPPEIGVYRIHVQSPSLNVEYETGPALTLRAIAKDRSKEQRSGEWS